MTLKKTLLTLSATAMLGVAGLAATTASAEARVVCNRYGDCWQSRTSYTYPSELGVRVYSDRYATPSYRERRWRDQRREWREERRERGYYKSGVWIQF